MSYFLLGKYGKSMAGEPTIVRETFEKNEYIIFTVIKISKLNYKTIKTHFNYV